jgi:hypothetical protein
MGKLAPSTTSSLGEKMTERRSVDVREFTYLGQTIILQCVVGQWIAKVFVTGNEPRHLTGVSQEATRELAESLVDELLNLQQRHRE